MNLTHIEQFETVAAPGKGLAYQIGFAVGYVVGSVAKIFG